MAPDGNAGVSSLKPDAKFTGNIHRDYPTDRNATSQDVFYTAANGAPESHPYEVKRAGASGPLLLQDFHLIDLLSHFDRERIPERVVHAKGGGAHGYFECTKSLEDVCMADVLGTVGKRCPVTVRFSTVGGESGSHDCARDPRGFSIKMKTEEGNWDIVANNTPVFFLRDPAKFPHFIHTQKRDPSSHLTGADDSTMFWDYLSQSPEAIHQVIYLFGDRGIPDGWRKCNAYLGHTVKLVNKKGEWVYAQWHVLSDLRKKEKEFLTVEEAGKCSPDYAIKDLYEAIASGNHPTWTYCVQTCTEQEAIALWEEEKINVFDLTHVWPHDKFPLREVGRMVLNENPQNYFAEIEQVAYNPSHMVPGIEPSADPVLQSRLFSYPDTHRHRVGVNYQQLPVNAPVTKYNMANFQRDGAGTFYSQGSRPNYLSSLDPIKFANRATPISSQSSHFDSTVTPFLSGIRIEDFNQPRKLWEKVFSAEGRERAIKNIADHMATSRHPESIKQMLGIFSYVSTELSDGIAKRLNVKDYPKDLSKVAFLGSHNLLDLKNPVKAANFSGGVICESNGAPLRHTPGI